MPTNNDIADRLEEFADLLEAMDVEYKPRAYQRAAESVTGASVSVEGLAAEGPESVAELEDVGEAISAKIVEYVETGTIEELEDLREELPVDMAALTSVEGVGPKTVASLYEALDVRTLDDLEAAAEAGEIQTVSGFGQKTEQNIRDNIDFAREAHERQLLSRALPRGERVREFLESVDAAEQVELAGSLRRRKPTIGDIDALVGSVEQEAVVETFTDWEAKEEVIEAGSNKASLRYGDVRVDLRVVDPAEFGAALQYFTGSLDHNISVRNRALDRDQKVNEYGVFDVSGVEDPDAGQRVGERLAGESEEEVYDALDMAWVPPELREDRGEVAASAAGDLPDLVTAEAVRGDLHVHTTWSDGSVSIAEMVEAAAEFGHDYVGIADHATGPGMVGGVGLSDEEIIDQVAEIREVAREADIEVLAGIEANIHADGEISVGDETLDAFDVVVASPHSALDGDGTDRLVAAAEHPAVDVIGHPTGRKLNQRPGLTVDVERLASVAADHGTALEVNADPHRLDLRGRDVQTALEAGATVVVNTDAHAPSSLDYLRHGVATARRGWAEVDDVLNTTGPADLREWLD